MIFFVPIVLKKNDIVCIENFKTSYYLLFYKNQLLSKIYSFRMEVLLSFLRNLRLTESHYQRFSLQQYARATNARVF